MSVIRYGATAKWLHWLIAVLVIIMLVTVSLYMRFAMGGRTGRDQSIM